MMNNLFSIFDTSTNSMFELNWVSSIMINLMIPIYFWFFYSKMNYLYMLMLNQFIKEFKILLSHKFNTMNMIYLMSLLTMIMFNNLMGLFPYVFTSSGHLIFSFSISLPMWVGLMMFSWQKNTNYMFSHMIPQGTPYILMPFMVLIESTSNMIRPGTLTIRLTANMIAGHLLLTLLSGSMNNNNMLLIIFMLNLIQIILLILEFSVSIIQSYVFTTLSTLYIKETN